MRNELDELDELKNSNINDNNIIQNIIQNEESGVIYTYISQEQSNNSKFYKKLSKARRMAMYRELKSIEPRMWTREHYLIKTGLTIFAVNFSLYGLWTIYYKHYRTEYKFVGSISCSTMAKLLLFGMFILNSFVLYFNTILIHDIVYSKHYEHLSDNDFFSMYESLLLKNEKNKRLNI
jgi:hypothetical protein